jgi:phosphoglycerate kinase
VTENPIELPGIEQLGDLRGRRVLVRSDLNVPMDGKMITDDGRIRASLPTWQQLGDAGARVIICAHLGRPKGEPDDRYSLRIVAERAARLLPGHDLTFVPETVGPAASAAVDLLQDGQCLLLENLRFNAGETSKDDVERGAFADSLAALADAYVGDGFGAVHRNHASVVDVPQRLPHAAGDLVRKEVEVLQRLTGEPDRPYAVVLGGAKVSDKLGVIGNLLTRVDRLLVGGGMAFTFLAAQGHEVGKSLLEADQIDKVRGFLADAEQRGVEIVLPVDVLAATEYAASARYDVVAVDAIPADRMGLDIGPASAQLFAGRLADARTIFWNGPMGVNEFAAFSNGTRVVAQAIADSAGYTVIGGGDSAAAVRDLGFADSAFDHISTGGGASLEYLEGKPLPGLDALAS